MTMQLPLRPSSPIPAHSRLFTGALWVVIAFAGIVIGSQLSDFRSPHHDPASLIGTVRHASDFASLTNLIDRETALDAAAGSDRYLDLALPKNTRVFMTGMTGPTNANRTGNFYFMTYYLFPREVAVNLDGPAHFTRQGLQGRSSDSDDEIRAHGYDLRIDLDSNAVIHIKELRSFSVSDTANPDWFDSRFDVIVAFLLPLFTALAGVGLFQFLFPTLAARSPLPAQLAYGFGLGMLAVAALTLGLKLFGPHGDRVVFSLTGAMSALVVWRHRKTYPEKIINGLNTICRRPLTVGTVAFGLVLFLILFRLAGLQGLVEFDAVASWALKAKIIHLYSGHELLQWMSEPRIAYAHLDYPTLVPCLHAATFDSISHPNDFVTKFWPAWMLLFLVAAIATVNGGENRSPALPIFIAGLLTLPVVLLYAQMEGGTMPMIFFTTLGLLQCVAWQIEKDPARLALGMTFLFGAAMTKFEGMILLALAAGWLLSPSARPSYQWSPRLGSLALFWLLAALPFIWLRTHIPVLHWESDWLHYGLAAPGHALACALVLFVILTAQLFFSERFATWTAENGHLHYDGQWQGWSSFYNHSNLGLAWFCLAMTAITWVAFPRHRAAILWPLVILAGMMAALSVVLASLAEAEGLDSVLHGLTNDLATGRYLLPMLIAWAAVIVTICFRNPDERPAAPVPDAAHAQ